MFDNLDYQELFNEVFMKTRYGIPVLLYGMGNGAEKIMDQCEKKGIEIADIFVSDDHYKEKEFRGHPLRSYSEISMKYDEAVILVAFGTEDPNIMMFIENLSEIYDVYVPDMALFGETTPILELGEDEIYETCSLFEESSQERFLSLINFKITGKLEYLSPIYSIKDRVYSTIDLGLKDEIYLDLGAYDGDTIREVYKYMLTHRYKPTKMKILAFEPDERNRKKLETFKEDFKDPEGIITGIEIYPYAVTDHRELLNFDSTSGRQASINPLGKTKVEGISLDEMNLDATVIKMDVEGEEEKALLGARKLIGDKKPRLIVSCYHRSKDILYLPKLIKSLNPDYKLELHQSPYIPCWDTNIIAY